MRRLIRTGCLGILAALAGAVPASAAETFTCRVQGALQIEGSVGLTKETRIFSIDGSAACTYSDGGQVVTDTGRLLSQGYLRNYACGIGIGFGSLYPHESIVVFPPGGPVPDISDFNYLFVAGGWQAAMDIRLATTENGAHGLGAGELTLVPAQGDCLGSGIDRFDLVGHLQFAF